MTKSVNDSLNEPAYIFDLSDLFDSTNGPRMNGSGINNHRLAVTLDKRPILELGINVPHKKSESAYFSELVSGLSSLGEDGGNCYRILQQALWIGLYDPTISSFSAGRRSSVRIHTSDEMFIKFLIEENAKHSIFKLDRILRKTNYLPSSQLLEYIADSPEQYSRVLALVDSSKVEEFHDKTLGLIRGYLSKQETAKKDLPRFEKVLRDLDELIMSGYSELKSDKRSIESKSPESVSRLFPSLEAIEQVYSEFCNKPYSLKDKPPITGPLSGINPLPTTLHKRANPGYSPNITSWEIGEPFRDLGIGGGRVLSGFKTRQEFFP